MRANERLSATAGPAVVAFFSSLGLVQAHEPFPESEAGSEKPAQVTEREVATEPVEVTVSGERPGSEAASRVHVSRRELELRPKRRTGELFEAVPGLVSVQHAGGGKADQWFLRGFDADHGTDVAFFVDGVPVNLVSHGHGQGYADVHFLIPELVASLDGYKGPYYAEFGDFATAGAVNLTLAEAFPESRAEYTFGEYGIHRGLVVASPKVGERLRAVLAGEVAANDGPFRNPEDLRRFNVFGRATHDLSANAKLSVTWMSYGSTWNGNGQIPARAVCGEGEPGSPPPEAFGEPCIDHFGTVDPSEGGATQRHQASLRYSASDRDSELSALVYWVRNRFTLYSNFTFFRDDPVRGDAIEQGDDRTMIGADARAARHFHYGPLKLTATFGLQARGDSIENSLWHSQARERLEPRVQAGVTETQLGLFAELDARLTKALRFVAGLRGDRIDVAVEDRLEARSTQGTRSSGVEGDQQLSPKLLAIVSPLSVLDLYASYGRGFHSNDARGVVQAQNPATLITPALGWDTGARFVPLEGLSFEAAGFLLDLDSEIVWSGDAGATEPSGRTRRYGLEVGGRYRLQNWLFADADLSLIRAEFRENPGNANAVALAPTRTFTAGIAARPTFGDTTPFGALRVKSIADRPATEDRSFTAEGFTTLDANAGVRFQNIEAAVDVQNVFDARYREVNFANESRLAYEPAPVNGIHYSPGWPRTVMARAAVYWD
jgi:outer membrane receptor protein involved in Fe transport